MVKHDILVQGVQLSGATQSKPVVLQMNSEDFPAAFLRDLGAVGQASLSSARAVATTPSTAATLFQPVTRVTHLAVAQLSCESVGFPRVDPARVVSAGLVIRRVPRTGGVSELSKPAASAWAWMKNAQGQFAWVQRDPSLGDDDPDPAQRPRLQSGQAALDQMLAAQTLSSALTEVTSPAYVAPPEVCAAAGRTLVYAPIPTASKEASTQQAPSAPQLDSGTATKLLTTLLKSGSHQFPQADQLVTLQFMSDDWVRANNKTDFLCFSATLRLLYTVLSVFDGSSGANAVMNVLNRRHVTVQNNSGVYVQRTMGAFYQEAAAKLMDYNPNSEPSGTADPQLRMPLTWEFFSARDQADLISAMLPLLQSRGQASMPPQGRFQDASRFYRIRLFFRIQGETSACPPELVWSCYSDPFRIAPWYESSGRPVAPVPLPDPFDPNTLKNAKPTSAFAVPASLMNAMQGANLTDLSNGKAPAGGGIGIGWICSFSIPLITICAFFVLNLFLSLLNIVFFWMAFIKICLPIPVPAPSPSPSED